MDIITLNKVKKGVYEPQKLAVIENEKEKLRAMLDSPDHFLLVLRACDGSYHRVSSDIGQIVQDKKALIVKGISLGPLATEIAGTAITGAQRFIVHESPEGIYLLGEVLEALKKLAEYYK